PRRVRGPDHLLARRAGDAPRAGLYQIEERAELREALAERARELQIEELRDALPQLVEMGHSERRRHAVVGAEHVDEHGHVEALDPLEQEGHVAIAGALGDAIGDLRDLEIA